MSVSTIFLDATLTIFPTISLDAALYISRQVDTDSVWQLRSVNKCAYNSFTNEIFKERLAQRYPVMRKDYNPLYNLCKIYPDQCWKIAYRIISQGKPSPISLKFIKQSLPDIIRALETQQLAIEDGLKEVCGKGDQDEESQSHCARIRKEGFEKNEKKMNSETIRLHIKSLVSSTSADPITYAVILRRFIYDLENNTIKTINKLSLLRELEKSSFEAPKHEIDEYFRQLQTHLNNEINLFKSTNDLLVKISTLKKCSELIQNIIEENQLKTPEALKQIQSIINQDFSTNDMRSTWLRLYRRCANNAQGDDHWAENNFGDHLQELKLIMDKDIFAHRGSLAGLEGQLKASFR